MSTAEPIKPEGVWLVTPDGPVELQIAYEGIDSAGQHQWVVTSEIVFHMGYDRILIDKLPAHTTVGIPADLIRHRKQ